MGGILHSTTNLEGGEKSQGAPVLVSRAQAQISPKAWIFFGWCECNHAGTSVARFSLWAQLEEVCLGMAQLFTRAH